MQVVYSKQEAPKTLAKSIFLAGPSPRGPEDPSWREEALEILESLGYDGVTFVPLPEDGQWPKVYDDQVDWETRCLNMADVVVFWVPRDLERLPAFTTNVEFGLWLESGKAVLGYPEGAAKMRYLDWHARRAGLPVFDTLEATLREAVERLGDGVERTGGERFVPLHIWRTPQFARWHEAQTGAGNRIDGARVVWTFSPDRGGGPFFWALHMDVHVGSEGRNKTIEVVLSRPDVSTVVAFRRGDTPETTFVALVREFRSPASTSDAFVLEVPGGSSHDTERDPAATAVDEFSEETGLAIHPKDLKTIGNRQCLATMSTHRATAFSYELSDSELEFLRAEAGRPKGVTEDTERTYVEVRTLAEIISGQAEVDWSNLGMIMAAIRL